MGYQYSVIEGNVGKEPELRYLTDGTPVCSFSVAVNKTWTKNGEKKEAVTWFKVTAWKKLAELCNEYLQKGQNVLVSGDVSVSAYTDRAGQPGASLELRANTVRFLGKREGSGDGETAPDSEDKTPF